MPCRSNELSLRLLEIATSCATGSLVFGCSTTGLSAPPESGTPGSITTTPVVVPTATNSELPENAQVETVPERDAADNAAHALCPAEDWQPLHGLRPARTYDHVALMERMGGGNAPAQMRWATGKVCATAQRPEECEKELERLALTVTQGRTQMGQVRSQHFLVTTRGDQVQAWTSREDWLGFLGTIDTPAEALLLAWYDLYNVECVRPATDGYRVKATRMTRDCAPIEITSFELRVSSEGRLVVESSEVISRSDACVGRRPQYLLRCKQPQEASVPEQAQVLAAFFAGVAQLEGAAVAAFQQVRRELVAYRAPPELVAEAERAQQDEVRHAWLMGRLALALGAEPKRPAVLASPIRAPHDAALDNATEGSVRETFGALVASYQGLTASSSRVRRLMQDVARDERRHATLSWRLHQWFRQRLPASSGRALERAQVAALRQLRQEWSQDPEPTLMDQAGLPSAKTAQRLLDAIEPLLA